MSKRKFSLIEQKINNYKTLNNGQILLCVYYILETYCIKLDNLGLKALLKFFFILFYYLTIIKRKLNNLPYHCSKCNNSLVSIKWK